MSDLYTSYETSLRLKEAGAPQQHGERYWASYAMHDHRLLAPLLPTDGQDLSPYARAFRADEIIEALGPVFSTINQEQSSLGEWCVWITGSSELLDPHWGASLVEALAAAWLAVLEGS